MSYFGWFHRLQNHLKWLVILEMFSSSDQVITDSHIHLETLNKLQKKYKRLFNRPPPLFKDKIPFLTKNLMKCYQLSSNDFYERYKSKLYTKLDKLLDLKGSEMILNQHKINKDLSKSYLMVYKLHWHLYSWFCKWYFETWWEILFYLYRWQKKTMIFWDYEGSRSEYQ